MSKRAYLFPGQGSQHVGMGKELYETNDLAHDIFEYANDILGYRITDVMFDGSEDDLKETRITQPAIFINSYVKARLLGDDLQPLAVAGHSLGEFTALTAARGLSFEDGLKLVYFRAEAMQRACEITPGTMAAIVGLDDAAIEEACADIDEIVVPANYNCPGQLVISGSVDGINKAVEVLTELGAKRAIVLAVGGAFHSPLMKPAEDELAEAINKTNFEKPVCPIYQNCTALPSDDPEVIRENLIKQLTAPVRWTQTMEHMIGDGLDNYAEVGARVLSGFMRRIDRKIPIEVI